MKKNISFSMEDLQSRIVLGRTALGERPTIKNTSFAVSQILEFMLAGMTVEDILDRYPNLEQEDVMAALFFASEAADHHVPAGAAV